jgi:bifunctional DNA-binding transcriptional regulator/antitoxin component of YhaV-PrlF toxin-antitoxin module
MPGPDKIVYTTTCGTDEEGNLVLEFPDELLDAMGWQEGTELEFDALPNTLILREVGKDTSEEISTPSRRKSTSKRRTQTVAS